MEIAYIMLQIAAIVVNSTEKIHCTLMRLICHNMSTRALRV